MRILGIDCGTQRTGYGLIESDGRSHRMIAAGSIDTSPKQPLGTSPARHRTRACVK